MAAPAIPPEAKRTVRDTGAGSPTRGTVIRPHCRRAAAKSASASSSGRHPVNRGWLPMKVQDLTSVGMPIASAKARSSFQSVGCSSRSWTGRKLRDSAGRRVCPRGGRARYLVLTDSHACFSRRRRPHRGDPGRTGSRSRLERSARLKAPAAAGNRSARRTSCRLATTEKRPYLPDDGERPVDAHGRAFAPLRTVVDHLCSRCARDAAALILVLGDPVFAPIYRSCPS